MPNELYYGDNLDILRRHIRDESIDLIYLDPPFNSSATYNMLFRAPDGASSAAQRKAFEDTWQWTDETENTFDDVMRHGNTRVAELLRALRDCLGENDLTAYLVMLTVRLLELHRVLKPNGSLYLHCDPTASHYIKVILDGVFGLPCFKNEIIWRRSHAHSDGRQGARHYGRVSDTILFYAKSNANTFNIQYAPYDPAYVARDYRRQDADGRRYRLDNIQGPGGAENGNPVYEVMGITRAWRYRKERMDQLIAEGRIVQTSSGAVPQYKRYLDEMPGVPLQNIWTDMPGINNRSQEFLGYPTQKPVKLLERIITASSLAGQSVLDPFCGCGTAVHAAQALDRHWIGIDITNLAIDLIERRLRKSFGDGARFSVLGTPADLSGAQSLAQRDKHEFQLWAVLRLGGVPFQGGKKGADGGIDGLIYFKPDGRKTERAIISVKGGDHVNVAMIRDLAHVVERERAKVGVFLTLTPPTKPMQTEAYRAGFYESEQGRHLKIQIITAEDLLAGKRPDIPLVDSSPFRAAAAHAPEQSRLLI